MCNKEATAVNAFTETLDHNFNVSVGLADSSHTLKGFQSKFIVVVSKFLLTAFSTLISQW
jgi:hypothetical protein